MIMKNISIFVGLIIILTILIGSLIYFPKSDNDKELYKSTDVIRVALQTRDSVLVEARIRFLYYEDVAIEHQTEFQSAVAEYFIINIKNYYSNDITQTNKEFWLFKESFDSHVNKEWTEKIGEVVYYVNFKIE